MPPIVYDPATGQYRTPTQFEEARGSYEQGVQSTYTGPSGLAPTGQQAVAAPVVTVQPAPTHIPTSQISPQNVAKIRETEPWRISTETREVIGTGGGKVVMSQEVVYAGPYITTTIPQTGQKLYMETHEEFLRSPNVQAALRPGISVIPQDFKITSPEQQQTAAMERARAEAEARYGTMTYGEKLGALAETAIYPEGWSILWGVPPSAVIKESMAQKIYLKNIQPPDYLTARYQTASTSFDVAGARRYEAAVGSRAMATAFESPVGFVASTAYLGAATGALAKASPVAAKVVTYGTLAWVGGTITHAAATGQTATAGKLAVQAGIGAVAAWGGARIAGGGQEMFRITSAKGLVEIRTELKPIETGPKLGEPMFGRRFLEPVGRTVEIGRAPPEAPKVLEARVIGKNVYVGEAGFRHEFGVSPPEFGGKFVIDEAALVKARVPPQAVSEAQRVETLLVSKAGADLPTVVRRVGSWEGSVAGVEPFAIRTEALKAPELAPSMRGYAAGYGIKFYQFTEPAPQPKAVKLTAEGPFPKTPFAKTWPKEGPPEILPKIAAETGKAAPLGGKVRAAEVRPEVRTWAEPIEARPRKAAFVEEESYAAPPWAQQLLKAPTAEVGGPKLVSRVIGVEAIKPGTRFLGMTGRIAGPERIQAVGRLEKPPERMMKQVPIAVPKRDIRLKQFTWVQPITREKQALVPRQEQRLGFEERLKFRQREDVVGGERFRPKEAFKPKLVILAPSVPPAGAFKMGKMPPRGRGRKAKAAQKTTLWIKRDPLTAMQESFEKGQARLKPIKRTVAAGRQFASKALGPSAAYYRFGPKTLRKQAKGRML